MPFASALASDGPEEDVASSSDLNFDNLNSRESGLGAGILPSTHSRQSSLARSTFSPSPSIGSSSNSVLGRRQRELGPQAWSSRDKVHIREFAADKCAEYELSPTDRLNILQDSEVSCQVSEMSLTDRELAGSFQHMSLWSSCCANLLNTSRSHKMMVLPHT